MNKDTFTQVQEIYYRKQNDARAKKELRKARLYAEIPAYKETEEEIASLGLEITKIALSGDGDISQIKEKMQKLTAFKKELLTKHGYGEDYVDDVYECRACRDSGYVSGEMCTCMKEEIQKRQTELSNIAGSLLCVTPDEFKLEYYPDVTDENGNNPRKIMENVLKGAADFMQNFDNPDTKNLLFYGDPGLGKTHLSAIIGNYIKENGKTVMYYSAKQLLSMITDNEFSREHPNKEECERAYECDLLIIDDLGSEHITSASVTSFFDILNTRMVNSRRMIINTNLGFKQMAETYSARIVSRLTEFNIFKFIGKDIRYIKASEG